MPDDPAAPQRSFNCLARWHPQFTSNPYPLETGPSIRSGTKAMPAGEVRAIKRQNESGAPARLRRQVSSDIARRESGRAGSEKRIRTQHHSSEVQDARPLPGDATNNLQSAGTCAAPRRAGASRSSSRSAVQTRSASPSTDFKRSRHLHRPRECSLLVPHRSTCTRSVSTTGSMT